MSSSEEPLKNSETSASNGNHMSSSEEHLKNYAIIRVRQKRLLKIHKPAPKMAIMSSSEEPVKIKNHQRLDPKLIYFRQSIRILSRDPALL